MKPILLLGEAYGTNEARIGAGFVGAAGIELLRMLGDAGVITATSEDADRIRKFYNTGDPTHLDMIWRMHPEVRRENVFDMHPPGNDMAWFYGEKDDAIRGYGKHTGGKSKKSGYIRQEFIPYLERLADRICAADPNIIVALGNTPAWALTGSCGISKIRGTTRLSTHTAEGFKILPTYHPSAVLQQWSLRPVTVADLAKAGREASFGEVRRPRREIWIEPTLEDIDAFFSRHLDPSTPVAVDIETAGQQITCIGLAANPGLAIVIPFFDSRRSGGSYWHSGGDEERVWERVRGVLERRDITKIFQNGLYDIAFLLRSVGIRVLGAEHDTMLLHHALQPESLKGLGFLGSVYCDEGAWKQERGHITTIKRDE